MIVYPIARLQKKEHQYLCNWGHAFWSYQTSDEEAVANACRFLKEADVDAIKLEGGRRVTSKIRAIADAGIVVFGHIGLTPRKVLDNQEDLKRKVELQIVHEN